MSAESKAVHRFCVDNGICVRCKCRKAKANSNLCQRCIGYILNISNSSIAKLLLRQHER